jgi:hypothetical protein
MIVRLLAQQLQEKAILKKLVHHETHFIKKA